MHIRYIVTICCTSLLVEMTCGFSMLGGGLFAKRPVILLDVDGVINSREQFLQDDWGTCETKAVQNGFINYSPELVEKVNAWNKIAEVRWLSPWDEEARDILAPALKLDAFKVARSHSEGLMKTTAAIRVGSEIGAEGLLIWIDDAIKDFRSCSLHDEEDMTGIFNRPNTVLLGPKDGLSRKHCAWVDRLLSDPSLSQGKVLHHFDK